MIKIKTKEEIETMARGGKILSEAVAEVLSQIKPGVSELELNQLAEELIIKKGAEPGFKKVKGYSHAICACTNNVVVHGIPTNYRLKEGDVFGIDCGVYYQGFYTDMARTLCVRDQKSILQCRIKNQNDQIDVFLGVGERALEEAIKIAKIGNRIGHISETIQSIIENAGYSVVRSLVGHGIGKELHEGPEIPGFIAQPLTKTPLLKEGMTLAIEVIYNIGKSEVVYTNKNDWTIATKDGSLSSTFEKTIVVSKEGSRVLAG